MPFHGDTFLAQIHSRASLERLMDTRGPAGKLISSRNCR